MAQSALPEDSSGLHQTAEEVYRKNLQLAEKNKTLTLLRKIDEIVLSAATDVDSAVTRVAQAVAEDSGFPFATIYVTNERKGVLQPRAVITRIGGEHAGGVAERELMGASISFRHSTNPMVRAVHKLMIVTSQHLFEVVQPALPIEETEQLQKELSLSTFFICPLQSRGDVLGAMVLGTAEKPDELSFYEKNLIERLAVSVGVALDNTLLYARSEEAAKRLRTANRHLKDLDKAKDEFISMASHQLRTPLTSIKGYLSMLLEGDAGKINKEQREFLTYAFAGSQRMVSLISDLLNVSRMAAGKFVIEAESTDITDIVQEEVDQLQRHADAKGLQLQFVPPKPKLPLMSIDEGKTRQVIMNFIDNAIYYTKQGSVTVTLKRKSRNVELRVEDTGIGVPDDAQKQLFTKFFRAPNAQVLRPDGTGLGLFLAQRVIEDQGGTIIFKSTEGKGSTFGFTLPLHGRRHGSSR